MPVETGEADLIAQNRRLVGISNTYMRGQEWFAHAADDIRAVLGDIRNLVVLPYALGDMESYTEKLAAAFARLGIESVDSPHRHVGDEYRVIEDAAAVYIGGGNTGRLLANLHGLTNADRTKVDTRATASRTSLVAALRARVAAGMPLIGASAGLNVMAADIRTTNDMHVAVQRLEDGSLVSRLDALGLLPSHLSVNPHYLEEVVLTDADRARAAEISDGLGLLAHHQIESRDARLTEAIEMDPSRVIIALRNGAYLALNGSTMHLKGQTGGVLFRHGQKPSEIGIGDDLSHLLQS